MSDQKTIDECKKLLEYTFSSKKQYASLVEFLFKVNKNDSIRVVGVDGKEKANYPNNSFLAKGVETVKELVIFLSVYLSHPLNVQTIYEMLPSYLKQTWDNVLDNLYVPVDCLDDKNKTDYLNFYGSYAEQCSGEWSWFFVISNEAHWRYSTCNVFAFTPFLLSIFF